MSALTKGHSAKKNINTLLVSTIFSQPIVNKAFMHFQYRDFFKEDQYLRSRKRGRDEISGNISMRVQVRTNLKQFIV